MELDAMTLSDVLFSSAVSFIIVSFIIETVYRSRESSKKIAGILSIIGLLLGIASVIYETNINPPGPGDITTLLVLVVFVVLRLKETISLFKDSKK